MAYLHGGRVVAKALKREGVSHLFTLCGGHIQAIYDGCIDEDIRVVDTRHEQTAGHAADGWARATGKPGVCAVTAGPGVTDVVTAVANAQRAGVPMLIIGGAGPRMFKHMGSLQDMDHVELMRPITKWSATVTTTARAAEYVATAFRIATTGVPGPVFLEMPLDLLMDNADEDEVVWPRNYRTEARPAGDEAAISAAADLLASAERPVLIIGSQIRWSRNAQALHQLLEGYAGPVFLNGMARGQLPPGHPCLFSQTRKQALSRADVVLVCGTPFDFRLGYGKPPTIPDEVKLIQVDLDGAEIGRNRGHDVGIHADTGLVLEALARRLKGTSSARQEWLAEMRTVEEKRQADIRREMETPGDPPNPLRVCAEVNRFLKEDTIVIGDGGDFVATAAYTLSISRPGCWMDPGPLGTLGVGPGYAMAAKLAHPSRDVVIMYGDGSFGLHAMEFEAMARQGIRVVAIIGNDAAWTQIRRGQVDLYGEERALATQLAYTRYDEVVKPLGCHGEYVERLADLGPALQRAFNAKVPAAVNVKIGASEFRKNAISV
ncbi:MAG: thiamine pyrophosphate-binding protein [Myxococcota bacterium]